MIYNALTRENAREEIVLQLLLRYDRLIFV